MSLWPHLLVQQVTPLGCISSISIHLNTSILPPLINHFFLWLPIHFLKLHLDWSSSSQLLTCDLFWNRIKDIKLYGTPDINKNAFLLDQMKPNFFLVSFFTKYLKNYLVFSFSVLANYVTIYDPNCGHSYFVVILLFSVLFYGTVLISTCWVPITYRISTRYQGHKAIKNTATPLIS